MLVVSYSNDVRVFVGEWFAFSDCWVEVAFVSAVIGRVESVSFADDWDFVLSGWWWALFVVIFEIVGSAVVDDR